MTEGRSSGRGCHTGRWRQPISLLLSLLYATISHDSCRLTMSQGEQWYVLLQCMIMHVIPFVVFNYCTSGLVLTNLNNIVMANNSLPNDQHSLLGLNLTEKAMTALCFIEAGSKQEGGGCTILSLLANSPLFRQHCALGVKRALLCAWIPAGCWYRRLTWPVPSSLLIIVLSSQNRDRLGIAVPQRLAWICSTHNPQMCVLLESGWLSKVVFNPAAVGV